jgi:hypothetical protein
MSRQVLFIAMVSACSWVITATDAHAQRPNRSVSRPTLSPYLNMFPQERRYTDSYNSMVRPYMQQRTRRDAGSPLDTTSNPVQTSELLRARERGQREQAVGIAPTGTNSVFMNMGHYYQFRNYRR